MALDDFSLVQDAFLEVGRVLFPNNPAELQDRYFRSDFADFDRMTREEIEVYLKRKKLEQLQKKALVEWESQSNGSGLILATIADTLDLILEHLKEQHTADYYADEQDNQFEI